MYIIVSCEHTNSFYEKPTLCGKFETRIDAERYCERMVNESLKEFKGECRIDNKYIVQTFDESGYPDYGCVWEIIEIK